MLRNRFVAIVVIISCSFIFQEDIFKAVAGGKIKVVRELIGQNPSLARMRDEHGRTPLHFAAESGFVEILKILLDNGAAIDAIDNHERTALSIASMKGFGEIVIILLDRGADRYAGDYGSSAFFSAVFNGKIEVMEIFLQHGTNINEQDMSGNSALHRAAFYCHFDMMKFLIEKGAEVNMLDGNGETALIRSASADYRGHNEHQPQEFAKLLIDAGADLDFKGRDGWTALHNAVWFGHVDLVKLLIKSGANVNVEADDGRTPLDFAKQQKFQEIIEILESEI